MHVLVTGAAGFVGRPLIAALTKAGHKVRATTRQIDGVEGIARDVELIPRIDLNVPVDWQPLLHEVDAVIHLAGIAHTGAAASDAIYDRVNRAATAELATAAARSGVNHLIFISSIRALCGPSSANVLTEDTSPAPCDAYGRSKLAAERAIINSAVPFTILRPSLVFGPGVKGNLRTLMRLAALPLPLPFGAFNNRRSLLSMTDLIAAIRLTLQGEPTRASYVVAHPEPVTLAEIIAALRRGLGRNTGLMSVPPSLLQYSLTAVGKRELWERIGGELIVDPSRFIKKSGWTTSVSLPESLAVFAQAETASADGAN